AAWPQGVVRIAAACQWGWRARNVEIADATAAHVDAPDAAVAGDGERSAALDRLAEGIRAGSRTADTRPVVAAPERDVDVRSVCVDCAAERCEAVALLSRRANAQGVGASERYLR